MDPKHGWIALRLRKVTKATDKKSKEPTKIGGKKSNLVNLKQHRLSKSV